MTPATRGPLSEEELRYWTLLLDPSHGYGELVIADAKTCLALNAALKAAYERETQALKVLELNHAHHQTFDEYGGYLDSDLYEKNDDAIRTLRNKL